MVRIRSLFAPSILIAVGVALAAAGAAANGDEHHDKHAAFGQPGDPAKVSRSVAIDMNDTMRYNPARISVKRGETIRFVVRNSGQLKHEVVLGTVKELREHAALMRKFPEMEHADPNQLAVDPGKTGELLWQFTKSGTFDFACLQPGHYEAGMHGKIAVKRPGDS
jgi:uncharacterized cupredoxin-like copper-binding protein